MQYVNNTNNLFSPANLKCIEINNLPANSVNQKDFLNGIQNAHNIVNNLEHSLRRYNKYEKKLLRCKSSHKHSHDSNEWWDSDFSDGKEYKSSKTDINKSSRSQVDLMESWSTMSIVCLQYQYEELSKRYESLLLAYNKRCEVVAVRDLSISLLRQRLSVTHSQLTHTHQTLLSVGDKYLTLKRRRNAQVNWYEKKIKSLKRTVNDVVDVAEYARLQCDVQLKRYLAQETDSEVAMLLTEIRKCNSLFLENLRLKAKIEEHTPE